MRDIADSDILSLAMEHNFWTWSAQSRVKPIPVKKADGVYFWDTAGKRYLDFNSMVMCVNIGHGNRHVIEAIQRQAGELPFAGPQMATKPRALLGEMLARITPGNLNYFLYTLGGADANENAIKLARAYTGKHKILSRYRSYHGASMGAISATGDPRRTAWEPNTGAGFIHFLDPYRYRSTFHRTNPAISEQEFCQDYLNHLEEIILFEQPGTIAGILLESVTGTNGIIIPPDGYLQGVRNLCDKYGILLIADEVMSGFGRTGAWFAVDHWNVVPDLMTMAKGLTSGYAPLGAVAMKPEIYHYFDDRVYEGGLTFNGHPISLAAAIANIEVMENEHLVENSFNMGKIIGEMNAELFDRHPSIGEYRNIGCFGILEFVKSRKTREPLAPFNSSSPEMKAFKEKLTELGLFAYTHWHTLLIIPPLCITEAQLQEGYAIIDHAAGILDQCVES
jgi:taurine--2-oxoglutarate transaminase